VPNETPKLSLVSDEIYQLGRKPETTSARVRRLQAEARILAREQVEALEKAMDAVSAQAREVAEGGDAYPAGVRDLASRLAEDLETRVQSMQVLMSRVPEPKL
jgi:hypothetical protein